MKKMISLFAQKNHNLLGLGDILSIISNCSENLVTARFILHNYEYHLVNENQVIPDRLLDYLTTGNNQGIELNYSEIILFSNFIFQSIDGEITIFLKENERIKLKIIDGDLWEISFDNENIFHCFLNNELIKEFKNNNG